MSEDAQVLRELLELNDCLSEMSEAFVRLVSDARILTGGEAASAAEAVGGDLYEVNVERLASQAKSALEKVSTLNKAIMLGNSGRQLYDNVRQTQMRLNKVQEKNRKLFSARSDGPVKDMQSTLRELEEHYYKSEYRDLDAGPEPDRAPDDIDAICALAMQTVLQQTNPHSNGVVTVPA